LIALNDCTYEFNKPVARRVIYGASDHLLGGFDHLTLLEVGNQTRIRYDAPQPDSVIEYLRAVREIVETNCIGKGSNLGAGLLLTSTLAARATGRVTIAFVTNGAEQGGKTTQLEAAAKSLALNSKVVAVLVVGLEARETMNYRALLEKRLVPLANAGKLLTSSFNPKAPNLIETDQQLEVFWRMAKR
jgi:hypothetical protein